MAILTDSSSIRVSHAKRLVISAVASASLLAGIVGVATPAQAEGSCPSEEWSLYPFAPGDDHWDINGDGLICVKFVNGTGNSRCCEGVVIKDDNN